MAAAPEKVVLETSMGNIGIELYWKHAPKTCRNFAELLKVASKKFIEWHKNLYKYHSATTGYYNNVKFHRIVKDFVIQGGDPTGTGRGGSSIYGGHFEDEISSDLKHTGAGVLSMANSGPNTNGSQFFITLAPTQWLDGKHTIFGRVCSGMDVVQKMSLVEVDHNDRPTASITILNARRLEQLE